MCTIFYTIRVSDNSETRDITISDLEQVAQKTLHTVLESLRTPQQEALVAVRTVNQALIELESALRLAHAAQKVHADLLAVFTEEIDLVHRSLSLYVQKYHAVMNYRTDTDDAPLPTRKKRTLATPQRQHVADVREPVAQKDNRKDIILDIVRQYGSASIKDIADKIKDCSEKTIQRDLNDLIKDNILIRQGERRWSRYSLS
ncbi:DeoR family transcriptional regulator [Candidatus Kaiserbacteria bacterium]|nr:DeoR family transcriptional regulator [Candidatus Kaiserbacteria bacterium]